MNDPLSNTHPRLTPGEELSQSLLLMLERRYLYSIPANGLAPIGPDMNWKPKTRFFQVTEVAHLADVQRSLHNLNMQNVLSTFRDG